MLRHPLVYLTLLLSACGTPPSPKPPTGSPVVSVKPTSSSADAQNPSKRRGSEKLGVGPNGETLSFSKVGRDVLIKSASGEERALDVAVLGSAPGERSLIAITASAATYLADGTLVVGVGDGNVVALDASDKRKWSVGFRGIINGLTPTEDGSFLVTTKSGVVAFVGSDGTVRWERQLVSDALTPAIVGPRGHFYVAGLQGVLVFSPSGDLVFSHAVKLSDSICCGGSADNVFAVSAAGRITAKGLDISIDDPHPDIVSAELVYPLGYERVLKENVISLVEAGPDERWAVVEVKDNRFEFLRISGGKTKRIPIPEYSARLEKDEGEPKPYKVRLAIDSVVIGPTGDPWLLARRVVPTDPDSPMRWMAFPAQAEILEVVSDKVRERSDLNAVFAEHLATSRETSAIVAVHAGKANLFCVGEDAQAICVLYNGAKFELLGPAATVTSMSRVGDKTYIVNAANKIYRLDGNSFVAVKPTIADSSYGVDDVGGSSDNDIWFSSRSSSVAYHDDGQDVTPRSAPTGFFGGIVARSPTDAWSANGQMHWDGKRWANVGGAESASTFALGAHGDVWIGNSKGIFHGKPPGLEPLHLPLATIFDKGALAAPPALVLGAPLAGYALARTSLPVQGGEPITTAKRVEPMPDGGLWIEAWDRLVEVDKEGKTTIINNEEKKIAFDRWFYPEASGQGILVSRARETEDYNNRDEIRNLAGGKAIAAPMQLTNNDVVAIAGNGAGVTWILGSLGAGSPYSYQRAMPYEWTPHALVRSEENGKWKPVLGLPSFAYVDMAVTPEGGGFFVGGLNPGPMGEGILVHAKGRLGAGSVTRYRAPASLLAVAAFGNDEAWAAGAAGNLMHIKGDRVERFVLPSGVWLRAVVGTGPNDVWFGGDEGTLLHYDGKIFQPVDHPLGSHAAFSGLAIARGILWAVGPSGIVRVTLSRKNP